MRIRDRRPTDGDALEAIATRTHAVDGYPKYLPADLKAFVMQPDAIRAWVAVDQGALLGHVALHSECAPTVMDLARAVTGLDDDGLIVLARLLVAPTARRRGVGRALFQRAASEAVSLGRRAVLDVLTEHTAAIRLYEESGWNRIGQVTWYLSDGRPLDEYVYVSPSP